MKVNSVREAVLLLTIHEKSVEENAVGEMNPNHSQSFRARIQAFESQGGEEEGNVSPSPQTSLPPRRASYKPPVAVKPSAACKSQREDDTSSNASTTQNYQYPFTSPRPQLPTNPGGKSIREELEALHSKGNTPHGSSPPVLTRSESIKEKEASEFPPMSSANPSREPLKPNLSINNHNLDPMYVEDDYVDSPVSE